ncbi:hypothetical protein, partial [Nitrobacter sp. 62-23]|uniref:hypothetical protein n=1 Tax=Nitrobacter sp. 62-23 TaxID=1895798 RepID=UPI0025E7F45E
KSSRTQGISPNQSPQEQLSIEPRAFLLLMNQKQTPGFFIDTFSSREPVFPSGCVDQTCRLSFGLSMIFSENRFPLFGIML